MDSKKILPISYFKAHANELLENIGDSQEPLIITQNGYAKAVVQDVKAYEKMKKTMTMLHLVAMAEKDIEAGRVIDNEDVFKKLERRPKTPRPKQKQA